MDDKDQKAQHLMGFLDNQLVAYTRLYDHNQYYKESSIGRVVVSPRHRNLKLGHELMQKSIETIERIFNTSNIRIGAQCYLLKFYESHGFKINGNEYLEDGIPHIEMTKI
jgi:ElaA protein